MEKIYKNVYKKDHYENDLIEKLFEYKHTKNKTWHEVADDLGYTRNYIAKLIQEDYPLPRLCREKLKWFLYNQAKKGA